MKNGNKNVKIRALLKCFFLRFAVLAAGWMIYVGELQLGDIWFVILFIAATTIISMYTIPPGQWVFRFMGVVRFIPFFFYMALLGGLDVSRRVFYRKVPVDPDFVTFDHGPNPQKTMILALVISLLPGTASTIINDDNIVVHVLDKNRPIAQEIQKLKVRINDMFVASTTEL